MRLHAYWTIIGLLLIGVIIRNVDCNSCDYIKLVKCFIGVLDDWAWSLYEARHNVVLLNEGGCVEFNKVDACVNDKNADDKHNCNLDEVLDAARTVSRLLIHRENNATFLKSYFLLEYSCGTKGRSQVERHRDCLNENRIGLSMLSASSYLDQKLHQNASMTPEQSCEILTHNLTVFRSAVKNECEGEAETLMCESLLNMFRKLEPDKLGSCKYNCSAPGGKWPDADKAAVKKAVGQTQANRSAVQKPETFMFVGILLRVLLSTM